MCVECVYFSVSHFSSSVFLLQVIFSKYDQTSLQHYQYSSKVVERSHVDYIMSLKCDSVNPF